MRLIDANEVIRRLPDDPSYIINIHHMLMQIPTIDAVPVVRCKDCKYWEKQKDPAQGRCILSRNYPTSAWFCANGERKDDAENE